MENNKTTLCFGLTQKKLAIHAMQTSIMVNFQDFIVAKMIKPCISKE